MIVAIGKLIKDNELIGLRIFNTDKNQTKDIRIEDKDKIKIKNIRSVNKLGTIDNKQEDKPIIVIEEKDNKYLTVDINGDIKTLNSLKGYNSIDLLTNVEQFERYMTKLSLIGEEPYFEFRVDKVNDKIIITKYRPNKEKNRIIEIPSFVTSLKVSIEYDEIQYSPFYNIEQNLKVIYKGNKLKSLKGMFSHYLGYNLDLNSFNTHNIENMDYMFANCYRLEKLNVNNMNTSKVTSMKSMFAECSNLKELNISSLDTRQVKNMSNMFYQCIRLKELDLSNFDTNKLLYRHYMLYGTGLTIESTGLKVEE